MSALDGWSCEGQLSLLPSATSPTPSPSKGEGGMSSTESAFIRVFRTEMEASERDWEERGRAEYERQAYGPA
jgi:hypothetical protein